MEASLVTVKPELNVASCATLNVESKVVAPWTYNLLFNDASLVTIKPELKVASCSQLKWNPTMSRSLRINCYSKKHRHPRKDSRSMKYRQFPR